MKTLTLSTSKKAPLHSNNKQISGIYRIIKNDNSICILQDDQIMGYDYQDESGNWKIRWNESITIQPNNYQWAFFDESINNEFLIMIHHPNGIRFYQIDLIHSRLQLVAEDSNFHEVYGWGKSDHILLFGRFYPNLSEIGVISRNAHGEIKFYAANEDSFLDENKSDPLFILDAELSYTSVWKVSSTEIFLTKLLHREPITIGLRSTDGLEFYEFDSDYNLKNILKTTQMAKYSNDNSTLDRLFFVDLTNQVYQDILHLNGSGLHVYQYSTIQNDYLHLHQHNGFTEFYGWSLKHTNSIKIADINQDGRDDLIFTGPQGLTVLTFDIKDVNWKMLLNPAHLDGKQRYAKIVGTLPKILPAITNPSLFKQDMDGNLEWTEVKIDTTTNLSIPIGTTTKQNRLQTQTTSCNNNLIPNSQIPRKDLILKPFMRLTEQFETSFFKDMVDTASGHVRFKLPLIDVSTTTAWNFQIELFYHSHGTNSDLLGEGWSINLAQDFIIVDYQGSIFPEDAIYYLVVQGQRQRLKLKATESVKLSFELVESSDGFIMSIEYDPLEQRWIIDGSAEEIIYGTSNGEKSKDALQWSLTWPYWRGPGSDKTQLRSLVIAWYVNTRISKINKSVLYYDYEQDKVKFGDKSYTAALRLKTIRDNQNFNLVLDYSTKAVNEYKVRELLDDEESVYFPITLAQSHFLKGFSLTTAKYQQTIQFIYQIENEKRLLTEIRQSLSSYQESLFKFRYQFFLKKPVLVNSSSTIGLNVKLDYNIVEPPLIPPSYKASYPIEKNIKIAYGSDYAVLSYLDPVREARKVFVRVMNLEMTKTINFCSNENSLCQSVESDVKDYEIHAYSDNFIIIVKTQQKYSIYFYQLHNQMWILEPTNHIFDKSALIVCSELLIAVVDNKNYNLTLFERSYLSNNSSWAKSKPVSINRHLSRLAIHNQLVVGYDDINLLLFYRDINLIWRFQTLASDLSTFQKVLGCFDLSQHTRQSLMTLLNKNGLQIFNNFIVFNSLQENDGQLSSHIHLFLLNDQYTVIKQEQFKIEQENIYEMSYELNYENSTYKLSYKKDKHFKLHITNISGDVVEEIKSIKNVNKRQDAYEERIEQLNESEGWNDFFKNNNLINLEQYIVQINQQGVYCGNKVLLQTTGTGWKRQQLSTDKSISLGDYFILEPSSDNKMYKLFVQDTNKNKGILIEEITPYVPGLIVNFYPVYIAYQDSSNSVRLLTFKDEKTEGQWHTFKNELLLLESNRQNLMTVANISTPYSLETQELRVRPLLKLATLHKPQLFISETELIEGDIHRLTGYRHSFKYNKASLTYSEKVTVIPGGNENVSGRYEATQHHHMSSGNFTKTEEWFDALGKSVLSPLEQNSNVDSDKQTNNTEDINSSLLFDREGKWLISDFTPYSIDDEMVAFYGFESYENNRISNQKAWRLVGTQLIEKGFSYTGENYLQLDDSDYIEGVFEPRDQATIYLASCWLKLSTSLVLNTPTSVLKATLKTTNGIKIIGLQAEVKYKLEDWSYLEILINFDVIKQIYKDYYNFSIAGNSSSIDILPVPQDAKFTITLQVTAENQQKVDLDHIRFMPLSLNFQAMVYHPLTGQTTAIIQTNGLVTKTLYNRLQTEIAGLQEDGELESLSSRSHTGRLIPSRENPISQMPATLTFEPEQGIYETFDNFAFRNRWEIDNNDAWSISPGQLWHYYPEKHRIQASSNLFDKKDAAFRCFFALQFKESFLSFNWTIIGNLQISWQSGDFSILTLSNGYSLKLLPLSGELIVMIDSNCMWLWLDGVLLLDQVIPTLSDIDSETPWNNFYIEAQGQVLLEDCFIMNRPQFKIEYQNTFGENVQVIQLADKNTIQITETLYDELGREAVTTKITRITRSAGESLLAFRNNFIINKNPADLQSVWQTDKLKGEVNELNPDDKGFAYMRTEYARNPLNEKSALGLAGSEFSITGSYATKFSSNSGIALLDNLFPTHKGYRQTVEYKSNGSLTVAVFNKQRNQVARYVQVPSFNHLLTTYEYDEENRLIKILPPLYHEKVDTASKIISWTTQDNSLTTEEEKWQQAFATFFYYDMNGHLIRKITPDTGITEYLYNRAGQKRFMLSIVSNDKHSTITYFDYNNNGQLVETGYIDKNLSVEALRQLLETSVLPYAKIYQKFDYADDNPNPLLRGQIKYFITYNENNQIVEELHYNNQQQIIVKNTLSTIEPYGVDKLTHFTKQYDENYLKSINYPITFNGNPFTLVQRFNKLGQLVSLGTSENSDFFIHFTYNANGYLNKEYYQQNTSYNFTRNYRYNSPGYLEKISDKFLTEEISYTENGYGQTGNGDGMVMQTAFNASWSNTADGRWFQLEQNDLNSEYSEKCIDALKSTGYLTFNHQVVKLFVRDIETDLPLVCNENLIAKQVAKKLIPRFYGHRYAYGNHQELVKAKYFTDETVSQADPLQPNSFHKEIPGITTKQSYDIWQLLTDGGYIISDQQQYDATTAVGKPGKSIFRDVELLEDLKLLNSNFIVYLNPIKRLVISSIIQQKALSLNVFIKAFLKLSSVNTSINAQQEEIANNIGNMLMDNMYLPTNSTAIPKVLDKSFTNILADYKNFLPNIVRVMSQHFLHRLGITAFDVESYKIDANGNHHMFYTGYNRFEFIYHDSSNQIQSIKLDWDSLLEPENTFAMRHDVQGNVVQALHKNIETIEYHPSSQRTTRIQLTDGRSLKFYYDAQGERILKQVFSSSGEISHETYYLRDEKGRVLVDQRIWYLPSQPAQKLVTAYIYGPRGMLGFIRNDIFYSVMTDHAGSIRLIIRDNQVVAAYDYLPYGDLMRSYGSDLQSQIMYRYTGQEYDEETGLYNYHARLYDPSIGRFYQPDPQSQYHSPYKYAGNSPVSLIDPDGEFAFLIPLLIAGTLVGTYLGGAAANNRWNPADWDFKESSTYFAMFGGALGGGLLPIGFAISVGTIGVGGTILAGISGSYLFTAAAHEDWAIWKWQFDRPNTYNALFQGFSSGTGFVGGFGVTHQFANTLSLFKKTLFLAVSYSSAGSIAYAHGIISNNNNIAFWEWDYSNPANWLDIINGFDTGLGWPQNFLEIGHGIGKLAMNPRKFGSLLGKEASKRQKLIAILKNPKHPFYKVTCSLVMAHFMGSSGNNNFNIIQWDLSSLSTYEGVLTGVFFGKDTSVMLDFARVSKTKEIPNNSLNTNKIKINIDCVSDFVNTLDNLKIIRKSKEIKNLLNSFPIEDLRFKSKDYSTSLKNQVEDFLKTGLKKWKEGRIQPPEVIQKFLVSELERNVRKSLGKLSELEENFNQLNKKKKEIHLDEDAEFLSCSKGARRRKRQTDISSESTENSNAFKNNTNNLADDNLIKYFVADHNEFKNNKFALLGYHKTSIEFASKMFVKGMKHNPFADNPQLKISENLETALNYGIADKDFRVLAVYAKKSDIDKISLTRDDLSQQFDISKLNSKNIDLKVEVLPIQNKNEVDILTKFYNQHRKAKKIIRELGAFPYLEDIDFDKNPKLAKILSDQTKKNVDLINDLKKTSANLEILSDLHQQNIRILSPLYKVHVEEMKTIFDVDNISNSDLNSIRTLYFDNNDFNSKFLLDGVENFKSLRDLLKIRSIYSKNYSKLNTINARTNENIKSILKLQNLSNDGFNLIKPFLMNPDLISTARNFRKFRNFISRKAFSEQESVKTIKNVLSLNLSNQNKIREVELNRKKLQKSIDGIINLSNDFTHELVNKILDIEELRVKMKLSDVPQVIKQQSESLVTDAIKDITQTKINDLTLNDDIKTLVKNDIKSSKSIKTIQSKKDLDFLSALKSFDDVQNFKDVKNLKKLEAFKNLKSNEASTVLKNLKTLTNQNNFKDFEESKRKKFVEAKEHLEKQYQTTNNGHVVQYVCGKRSKRSIESFEENEEDFIFLKNQSFLDTDKITTDSEIPIVSTSKVPSSSSNIYTNFWPIRLTKTIKNNLSYISNAIGRRLYNSVWRSNSDFISQSSTSANFVTHFTENENNWFFKSHNNFDAKGVNNLMTMHHLQGGLQLTDLLVRKLTGVNYQQFSTVIDPLDEMECRLQASLQHWENISIHDKV